MTIEEFNTSLANLIVQKDSLNAQYTNLIRLVISAELRPELCRYQATEEPVESDET